MLARNFILLAGLVHDETTILIGSLSGPISSYTTAEMDRFCLKYKYDSGKISDCILSSCLEHGMTNRIF